jgi:hypothetical protein
LTRAATAAIAQAQTKVDEEAVHNLPQASSAAFNKWIHGKPDFEKYHTRLLNGRGAGRVLVTKTRMAPRASGGWE